MHAYTTEAVFETFYFDEEPNYQRALGLSGRVNYQQLLDDARKQLDAATKSPATSDKKLADLSFILAAVARRAQRLGVVPTSRATAVNTHEDRAAQRIRKAYGKNSMPMVYLHLSRAVAAGRIDYATPHFRRALALTKRLHGEHSVAHYTVQSMIGGLLLRNYPRQAFGYLQPAADGLDALLPHGHPQRAHVAFRLGQYYRRRISDQRLAAEQSFADKAIRSLRDATEHYATAGQGASLLNLDAHRMLYELLLARGEHEAAAFHDAAPSRHVPDGGNAPALLLHRERPAAGDSGWLNGGNVTLRFTISEAGHATEIVVVGGSAAQSLSERAVELLMNYRYRPQFIGGKPVALQNVETTIRFDSVLPVPGR